MLIPTSGTTGRSKLVTQTHRAYVMAGEGFPWWMELTADDRLMTSLPLFHINAPTYSVLGSIAARAGLVLLPRFSASALHRRRPPPRRHRVQRDRRDARDPDAPARAPRRRRQPAAALLHRARRRREQRQLEIEARFGLRIVCGYAMSETPYGLDLARAARARTARSAAPRQHPTLGTSTTRGDARRRAGAWRVGELQLRNPAVMKGYWGMPEETAQRAARRTAGCAPATSSRRTPTAPTPSSAAQKEVIRRRGENVAPAEIEEALAAHPDVLEAAVDRRARPSSPRRRSRRFVLVATRRGRPGRDPRARRRAPDAASRCRATSRPSPSCRTRPTGRIAKHQLPTRAHRPGGRLRGRMSDDWLRTGIGASDADSITLMGRDLASELMGEVTLHRAHLPARAQADAEPGARRALLDAVLVSLADHGLTPTVLAARLTHTGAPESLQGAIAAGLLGAGSVFLGVVEDTARFLDEIARRRRRRGRARGGGARRGRPARSPASATRSTRSRTRARRGSTRSPRRPGMLGPHLRSAARWSPRPRREQTGRAPADQRRRRRRAPRWPTSASRRASLRGFALLARTAGLLGHLAEEMRAARSACRSTSRSTSARPYDPPDR